VEAGMAVEPAGDRGVFASGVIIGDDVDVEIGRGVVVDGFKNGEPFLKAVARRQLGDQLSLEIVERGKQGQRAMAITAPTDGARPSRSVSTVPRGCRLLGAVH